MLYTLLSICLFAQFVKADDDWDDFTNNLATDLAPLITLFGERLTKQFLSESISALDNVIFALSPLGVLTAVVSVIRICGSSSLRAFVGRAQEGPAEAESELLPCVSASTAELFNDGGVTRVLGRPKIMEIVAWEESNDNHGEKSTKIGTIKEALAAGAWSCKAKIAPSELPELDIPNLSLNKGIKRRGQSWFYCAAVLGGILQGGTIMYAAITVFVYPQHFEKNGKAVASYAFPFYFIGTSLLFIGMFFCAFIMERSSKEFYLRPEKPSKIYWVQPGNQDVGDQAFNAFLAVKENPDEYIKSVRDRRFDRKYLEIYSTLASTLLGFILQFVGLRGLHASVILAQLGSTFLMAIIRTCLRTERMAPEENKMKDQRELTSHKKQELDCFAFYLEELECFNLVPIPTRAAGMPSPSFTPQVGTLLAKQVIQTRVELARLTSDSSQSSDVSWNSMPIRQVAIKLAQAIESTMDLLCSWGVEFGISYEFRLAFECTKLAPKNPDSTPGTYSIGLLRCGDVLRWEIDVNELEAVIGLWTWSLYQSDPRWRDSTLCRLVGMDEDEASKEATYLYFHKWVFRQTEARLVGSDQMNQAQRLFTYEPKEAPFDKRILTMRTPSELEFLVAQDIFVHFLMEVFTNLKELAGEVDIVPGVQGSFLGLSSRINDLVSEFEKSGLGSREDALLCIVPVLNKRNLLPDLAGDSPMVKTRIKGFIDQGMWTSAFAMLRWICERSEGPEFEKSVFELGDLCHRAMLSSNMSIRNEGIEQTCKLLKSDLQDEFLLSRLKVLPSDWRKSQDRVAWWDSFCGQLGWIAWEISNADPGMQPTRDTLRRLGVQETLQNVNGSASDAKDLQSSTRMFKRWLTIDHDREGGMPPLEDGDQIFFQWTVHHNQYALLYFMLMRWIELITHSPEYTPMLYFVAAQNRSHWAIQVLVRQGVNINAVDEHCRSALVNHILLMDLEGARMLLENGADVNGGDDLQAPKPLLAAIKTAHVDMMELVLQNGASPHTFIKGLSVMGWATRTGEIAPVDVLLRYGAAINLIEHDKTPLMIAAEEEKHDLLAFLIDQGADIDVRDSEGCTAIMSAARWARPEVLELLAQRGADLHVRNNNGLTALQLAGGIEENFVARCREQNQDVGFMGQDSAQGRDWHSRLLRSIAILERLCRY